jgi:hypothetical protein
VSGLLRDSRQLYGICAYTAVIVADYGTGVCLLLNADTCKLCGLPDSDLCEM